MNGMMQQHKANLGTFAGVFTPSVLTILGIILFLRLGYVVGNAGLALALIIIALSNGISVLTSISLSAIATNLKVKGGGDYYVISRTLGLGFGGAIGIVLFLAQSVSIAFYCIGFGEATTAMLPQHLPFSPRIVAALAVTFLFVFAWLGADWATRFQYVVMGLLSAALLSFFWGGLSTWKVATFTENWRVSVDGASFWLLFAIFFPAVTGFTQGVSMSGDLKDAGKSLPLGTFLAVGISITVYFGVAFVFGGALPSDVMRSDYFSMKRIAKLGFLIDAGVIAATLSSAMASFLGAPRILQSLAGDRIFPFLHAFSKGAGPMNNPRRGVILSAGIAFATIALGNLNVIAPVVSMFFLISYGLLNYATFFEARAASPSFRPRFRLFDYRLSLLGALACLGVMLAIDLRAGIISISILFGIYQYLKRTAGPARWADSRRSYYLHNVRENLLAAASEPEHPRDWRPNILALSNDPNRREELLTFASWIRGNSGLTTAVKILEGEGLQMLKLKEEAETELRGDILDHDMAAFPLIVVAPKLEIGVQTLVQAFGIGPLKANTILLNWVEPLPKGVFGLREIGYARNLRTAFRLGCNIVVLDAKETSWLALNSTPSEERRIDVWWWDDASSHLMLLLAYLMTRSDVWEASKIRVLAGCYNQESEETLKDLQKKLEEARIEAEAEIIANADTESVVHHSADATLVFLPFRLRGNQILDPFSNRLEELLSCLPLVSLVLAAEDVDLDAEPDEGKAAEVAAALDALKEAEKRSEQAEKAAIKEAEEARRKSIEINFGAQDGSDPEETARLKAEAHKALRQADRAARKAAKEELRLEDAKRKVESLGVQIPKEKEQNGPNTHPAEEEEKTDGSRRPPRPS
jgi:amino acid transporter